MAIMILFHASQAYLAIDEIPKGDNAHNKVCVKTIFHTFIGFVRVGSKRAKQAYLIKFWLYHFQKCFIILATLILNFSDF